MADWENNIFDATYYNFNRVALEIFFFQYMHNEMYKNYVDALGILPARVHSIETIPFLPVSFFKTHPVTTTSFEPERIFESSGTTGAPASRHLVADLALYARSYQNAFSLFYGNPKDWCILGLLPGYLERRNSSLVTMVHGLITQTDNPYSGFYLHDLDKLYQALVHNEIVGKPTLLIGVTYALLEFAEKYPMKLRQTIVMETGGMKGRREEITRDEVHEFLRARMGVDTIHSEYGMTELLSQAYSRGAGIFHCPPWMKVLVREYNDPLSVSGAPRTAAAVSGLINVIDLCNLYSCCFVATDDVGKLYKNDTFEVLGRRDLSDLRGCSLLTA